MTTRRPPTPRNRRGTGAPQRGASQPGASQPGEGPRRGGRTPRRSARSGTSHHRPAARSASRPASNRTQAARGPTDRPRTGPRTGPSAARADRGGSTKKSQPEQPGQPRQITVRGLVLFVVVLMAFIVLAPTLRAFVNQQEEHRELATRINATQEHNEQLREEIERWDSDAYVEAQARERLGFVMPGQTPYRVVDPQVITGEEAPIDSDDGDQGPVEVAPEGPWYVTVWESVQLAGDEE